MERNDKRGTETATTQATEASERDDRVEDLLASRQEFLQVFKRGAEFTEELLRENERLRYRVAQLESSQRTVPAHADNALVRELMDKIARVEDEKRELADRMAGVESANRDFASRYVEIEQENNNLLNIYIASYQLHSTLEFDAVLAAINEVVLNFIGGEVFTVGMIERAGSAEIRTLLATGCEIADVPASNPVVADVLDSGMPYFATELEDRPVDLSAPQICIPLHINTQTIGFLSIYKFLQHKKRLASVDHELFTLLAGHAATALFAAKLYTDSKRKLSTIQGFIDLVTSPANANTSAG